ncbi:hypothetical protein Godav_028143 [Gossypium davidsonii]|uniref:RNase H type-1 domain-containing protein n=1 Tax=Gossypium davidsonii TaxID=34287 RepID=A0A7J8RYG6_GOSDV|nr:hypothetical protein [Gossypium davidsonii]
MAEYEGIKVVKKIERIYRGYRIQEDVPRITIQFDAALDNRTFKLATGLVGWDMRGNLLVLKTVIHRNVPSPFAIEAYACLEGIKLGIALRTQSVRIMGDSKTVIKKSQATSTDKSSRKETGKGTRIEEMVEGAAFNTDSLMMLNPLEELSI